MNAIHRAAAVGIMVVVWVSAPQALGVETEPAAGFDLITNGSFEGDWFNTRAEVMSCPVQPRVTFGQTDGIVDGWNVGECRRVAGGHGIYAMELAPGKPLVQDKINYAIVQNTQFQAVPLLFSAYVKGTGQTINVNIALYSADAVTEALKAAPPKEPPALAKHTQSVAAPAGQWTRVAVEVPAEKIGAAIKAAPKPPGAIAATLTLTAEGAAAMVDDVRLERAFLAAPYTVIPNAGFEDVGPDGAPAEWSLVKKSLRHVGSWYYIWRSWYHTLGVPRGANGVDNVMAAAGKHSFRMNVPPGDHKYVESGAALLNQAAPQRMALQFEYNAYMLADMIVQVMDDQGKEVYFDVVSPGTTGGWHRYQAVFTPAPVEPKTTGGGAGVPQAAGAPVALKSCRVRINVRGVNGSDHDDINRWVNINHAGVLWVDNVALFEMESSEQQLAARGGKTFVSDTAAPALVVEAIDLGERLYGDNRATVTLANLGGAAAVGNVTMNIAGPFREDDPQKAGYANGTAGQEKMEAPPAKGPDQSPSAVYNLASKQRVTLELPYAVSELAPDWRSEYRVKVGVNNASTDLTFGTWNQKVRVDVLRCYSFPSEPEQTVSMNIGVARPTLLKTTSVKLEVRKAADDKAVMTQELPNFSSLVAGFNLSPLPGAPGTPDAWQGDDTNFAQAKLDIRQLPEHSQTEPVRDHYVYVVGTDAAGKVTFDGKSPRFGRMQMHAEVLSPIQSISISKKNHLVINGKPFFNRGHMQMPQNFGPSPMSHLPMNWKQTGFNTGGVGQAASEATQTPDVDWKQNLYMISHSIAGAPPMTDATKSLIQQLVSQPNVIGVNYIQWEGAPTGGTDEQRVEYAKQIKAAANGHPLWMSAGWYAPTVDGIVYPDYLEHDIFAPENNAYFQPSQLDREVLTKKMARGEPCVLNTYPNVFNDMPWPVQRFEHWTEIIRSHTGYTIIGIPGDPTLDRGLNGEIRFMESFLFSEEPAPQVSVAPNLEHMVRSANGKTYLMATNSGPVIGGDWKWNTELKDKGVASHTGDALWSRFHPFMGDYHEHFYHSDRPVTAKKGDKLVQYVMIPQGQKVESLVLMARGDGDWRYQAVWGAWNEQQFTASGVRLWMAKDMHQMFWGTIGFCGPDGKPTPEGQAKLEKYAFTEPEFKNQGALPESGRFVRLEVPVESLGLDGKVIDGFGFLSKGANVWWERTLLVQDGKEIALCDGSVGPSPASLKSVRFNVPGLKAGSKIQVVFDEREITSQDGFFEDDLTGEPGYENVWVGIYGDKIGETGYYGDGTFYNYNWGRIATRLYEIPK